MALRVMRGRADLTRPKEPARSQVQSFTGAHPFAGSAKGWAPAVVLPSGSRESGQRLPTTHGSASQEKSYFFTGFLLVCFSTPFSLISDIASLALNG